jgi:hypothetical protein
MGLIATASNIFRIIADERDAQYLEECVKDFKLFVIILSDPVKDAQFYEHIHGNFDYLDSLTGHRIMFMTLVKDPDHQSAHYRSANKHEHRRELYHIGRDIPMKDQIANFSNHSNIVIQSICELLGLDYDDTPALVISDSIRFKSFFTISTDSESVHDQFKSLLKATNDLGSSINKPSIEKTLQHRAMDRWRDFCSEVITMKRSEKELIGHILDLSEMDERFRHHERFAESVDDMVLKLNKISAIDHEKKIRIASLSMPFFKKRTAANRRGIRHDNESIVEKLEMNIPVLHEITSEVPLPTRLMKSWKDIESSSLNNLDGSELILSARLNRMKRLDDFSLYTFPLCKTFETEINRSVVQMMRMMNQIDMPRYFHKHCPALGKVEIIPDKVYKENAKAIPLNAKNPKGWVPPGLTQSMILYLNYTREMARPLYGWLETDLHHELTIHWRILAAIRNESAHPNGIPSKRMQEMEESLKQLDDLNILNRLTALKREMMKDANMRR